MVESKTEIETLEAEILEKKKRVAELKRAQPRERVGEFRFETPDGEVKLSDFFGERSDLLVIHNMGQSCVYCTLWADGFNGVLPHLENRTNVVLVSPDPVERQQKFAQDRGWKFRMVRDASGEFTKAMGYLSDEQGFWPGATSFTRTPGKTIERVASAIFGEGDDFCPTWHLLDLLADGPNGWEPKYRYVDPA